MRSTQLGALGDHHRIEALVRKYAPWPCATAWVDLDDYRSEAWEAVWRVTQRYSALPTPDFENLTVAAVRNALINLRRRVILSRDRTPVLPARQWANVIDPIDRYEQVISTMFIEQVGARLRAPVRRVLNAALALGSTTSRFCVPTTTIAAAVGACPDTLRARRSELGRILRRELAMPSHATGAKASTSTFPVTIVK